MKFNLLKNIKEKVCGWINNNKSVKQKDLSIFTKELSILYKCGIPLHKSLRIISKQTGNFKLKKTLKEIYAKIAEKGYSFCSALAQYPEIFSSDYVHMVYLGEKTGTLHKILIKIAESNEKEYNFNQKIKSEILYPVISTIIAFFGILLIIKYIVPSFVLLFLSFNINLPLSTKFLMLISGFLSNPGHLIITVSAVSIGGYQLNCHIKTPAGKYQFDILKTKLPIINIIFEKLLVIKFCQSLLLLYGSGINLIKSLETIKQTINNTSLSNITTCIIEQIKQGCSFSESLKKHKIFPPMVTNLISTAEESCRLEEILNKILTYYNLEIDCILNKIQALLAPLILVILGIIVGFIFMAVFNPIYSVITNLEI